MKRSSRKHPHEWGHFNRAQANTVNAMFRYFRTHTALHRRRLSYWGRVTDAYFRRVPMPPEQETQ
jgi:hypothetical protein